MSRSSAGVTSPIHVVASTNMDPLQDPHLRIHVSTSLCLRLLCKIHVSGFMSQHPCVSQDPLQGPCCRIHSPAAICISGSSTRPTSSDSYLSIFVSHGFSARSTSPDTCLSIHLYLRILCKIHVSGSIYKHPFVSQDPLQDPCPRFMSQHLFISCLRIHVSDSCLSIFISQRPLQDPRLRIHVSASLYLKILCKIFVSGSIYKHPFVSQDPLQDPCPRFMSQHLFISGSSARSMSPDSCLSIFISQDALQDPCLRIHISASICIAGSSARSMSPDPSLSIFISQDPCRSIHTSLRILCKTHVSGSMSPIHVSASTYPDPLRDPCISIHVSVSLSVDPLHDPYRSIHTGGSCTKSTRRAFFCGQPGAFSQGEMVIIYDLHNGCSFSTLILLAFHGDVFMWKCWSLTYVANAHFDLPRRIFCGPAQAKRKF